MASNIVAFGFRGTSITINLNTSRIVGTSIQRNVSRLSTVRNDKENDNCNKNSFGRCVLSHRSRFGSGSGSRCFSTDFSVDNTVRRRRRNIGKKINQESLVPMYLRQNSKDVVYRQLRGVGGLEEPYNYDGEKPTEEYLKKTSLSPWVPMPDAVARKMFDIAQPTSDDVHIDLGSGDGRVNFHAIGYGVKESIGIDIDKGILDVANQRLMKIHPQPSIQFIKADLLNDMNHKVWEDKIQNATIITMFFVSDALQQLRPILERKLSFAMKKDSNKKPIKIITCSYEMPGWNASIIATVLGMTVYLYEWGINTDIYNIEQDDADGMHGINEISNPRSGLSAEKNQHGSLVDKLNNNTYSDVEHVRPILPGFDPKEMIEDDWDTKDDDDDFDDNENDETLSEEELQKEKKRRARDMMKKNFYFEIRDLKNRNKKFDNEREKVAVKNHVKSRSLDEKKSKDESNIKGKKKKRIIDDDFSFKDFVKNKHKLPTDS